MENKDIELQAIGEKILKEEEISTIELMAYVLGRGLNGESSLAVAEDLLSCFGGWDGLFRATRKDLEEFGQLSEGQIDMIWVIEHIKDMMSEKS